MDVTDVIFSYSSALIPAGLLLFNISEKMISTFVIQILKCSNISIPFILVYFNIANSAEISFIFDFASVWAGVHAVWAGVHAVWAGVHAVWVRAHAV